MISGIIKVKVSVISQGRRLRLITNPCCSVVVIFCGYNSHLSGRETINIPEIFYGVHGFTGKTVKNSLYVNITDISRV